MRSSLAATSILALAFVFACSKRPKEDGPSQMAGAAAPEPAPSSSPEPAPPADPEPVAPPDAVAITTLGKAPTSSTVVLGQIKDRRVAFVADEDGHAVYTVDLATHKPIATTKLPSRPAQMLVASGRLLVALRDSARVLALAALPDAEKPMAAAARFSTPEEPLAMASEGDKLLVASGVSHTVSRYDAATYEPKGRFDVGREPRAVMLSKDGSKAYVTHAAESFVTVLALDVAAPIGKVGLDAHLHAAPMAKAPRMPPPPEPGQPPPPPVVARKVPLDGDFFATESMVIPPLDARQGFALARFDGKEERIFVPHTYVDSGGKTSITGGYGGGGSIATTNAFDLDVLLASSGTLAPGMRSVEAVMDRRRFGKEGCLLPRAAVASDELSEVYVACLGINVVAEFDAIQGSPAAFPKRRFAVPSGPTGLATVGAELVVFSQFAREVSFVALDAKGEIAHVALPPSEKPMDEKLALGRKLFHAAGDPRLSSDGRACASCHPDGRDDGLVWSTPEGPRQTPILAGRVNHAPPFGWRGEHPTLKAHLTETFKRLSGKGLEGAELEALMAYLDAMPAPPSPPERALDDAEARGKTVFHSSRAGCATCHVDRSGFSDREVHDVQSAAQVDKHKAFVTPSLKYVASSAPYFHDGRYATLAALLKDSDGKMGSTSHLSPEDMRALEAYLRTL